MEWGRGAALRGVWMLEPGRDGLAFMRESRMHRGQLGYRGRRPGPAQQGRVRFHGRLRSRLQCSAVHGAGSRSCFAWRVDVGAGP